MRVFVGLALTASLVLACDRRDDPGAAFLDAPVTVLREDLAAGRLTAEAVTRAVLDRIAALDDAGPRLNAIIEINPEAIEIARELDRRFARGGPVGVLHGVPVVVKANIDTADRMATSAGSVALADHHAAADAELVTLLREAGAIIIGKANLSEWANFRGIRSSSGWSSLGGQTHNPYVLDRSPCGSSSGSAVAVAARLVPLAVGTETIGSISCPSAVNGIVGIKPTHGSVSRRGIVPVAATFDVAGPMARTVKGAALLLGALQGRAELAAAIEYRDDLTGVRIGVLRDYRGAGEAPRMEAAWQRSLATLEGAGAVLVDPIELALSPSVSQSALEVMLFEFKAGINAYLAESALSPGSLAELIEYNSTHAARVLPHFGQEYFAAAQQHGGLDDPAYLEALTGSRGVLRMRLHARFAEAGIDTLVAPVSDPAWEIDWEHGDALSISSSVVAAVSGFPSVVVPAGTVDGLPIATVFIGLPSSESSLIAIAAAFEAARGEQPGPTFIDSLDDQTHR
jgi:amidase